jgi:hypothetical protein
MHRTPALVLGALLIAEPAHADGRALAEPAPDPVLLLDVEYTAPTHCPPRAAFLAELETRAGKRVVEGGAAQKVRISIAQTAAGFEAHLVVTTSQGRELARTLDESECRPLVPATALVLALALQHLKETEAGEPEVMAEEPGVPRGERASVLDEPSVAPTALPTEAPSQRAARWLAGVEGAVSGALAPNLSYGGTVSAGLELPALSLRLGATHLRSPAWEVSGGGLRFSLTGVRAEACPGGNLVHGPWLLEFCGAAGAGVLVAGGVQGSAVQRAEEKLFFWPGLAALARVGWAFGAWRVELHGDAVVALRREDFLFRIPEPVVVHESHRVAPAVGLGLVWQKE